MRIATAVLLVFMTMAVVVTGAQAEISIGVAAPLTGSNAYMGDFTRSTVMNAVADLNGTGGVLGQQVRVIVVDDYCDPQQAVVAANKLADAGVAFVTGHPCSGAAIPAAKVYGAAGILFIACEATNPL